jgi:hypothetical protein
MKGDDKHLIDLLNGEWEMFEKSINTLELSRNKCSKLYLKKDYTFEEEEAFDSLTSKYGRTSDLYTQKILRTTWMLLHEAFMPFIDMMNQCEKIGIINSSDALIEIRDLRNQVAHEYIPESVNSLVPEVLNMTCVLFENIDRTRTFLKDRNWLTDA